MYGVNFAGSGICVPMPCHAWMAKLNSFIVVLHASYLQSPLCMYMLLECSTRIHVVRLAGIVIIIIIIIIIIILSLVVAPIIFCFAFLFACYACLENNAICLTMQLMGFRNEVHSLSQLVF